MTIFLFSVTNFRVSISFIKSRLLPAPLFDGWSWQDLIIKFHLEEVNIEHSYYAHFLHYEDLMK